MYFQRVALLRHSESYHNILHPLVLKATERNKSTYQLFTLQPETMLTCRQLAVLPLEVFRSPICAKTRQTRTASKRKKKRHQQEMLLCTLRATSSPHFHLKLSEEVGAMFVSALIVELDSFAPERLSLSDWNRPEKRKRNKPPLQPTDRGLLERERPGTLQSYRFRSALST